MSLNVAASRCRAARLLLTLLAIAASACAANAQPTGFVEDFAGPNLDLEWMPDGDPAGHPGTIAGTYDITDAFGPVGMPIGVKLSRSTAGTLSSYTHEIEVVLDPFRPSGSGGGTLTDVKWKTFGPDGFMELVLNSFGNLRLFHDDFNDAVPGGNIAGGAPDNINIGYADGDLLNLTTVYDTNTDTINVTYSLNGGSAQAFYSGGGISGPIGDFITNFVEVEVFKFGEAEPTQAIAAIDNWSLAASTGGIPGDYNSDNFVSQGDLDLVLLSWGDTVAPPGFDENAIPGGGPFDGLMGQNELDGVLLNWGNGTPPVVAVPEPGAAISLLVAFVALNASSRTRIRVRG